jgi:hypothetical protein
MRSGRSWSTSTTTDASLREGCWSWTVAWSSGVWSTPSSSPRRRTPEPVRGGEHARLAWTGSVAGWSTARAPLAVVRDYFTRAGFVEVETPARLRTPALEPHVDALPAGADWLVTSPSST